MADLSTLQARLTSLEAARDRILTSQEYISGEFRNRRPDLKVVLDEIKSTEMQIARIQGKTTTNPLFGSRR